MKKMTLGKLKEGISRRLDMFDEVAEFVLFWFLQITAIVGAFYLYKHVIEQLFGVRPLEQSFFDLGFFIVFLPPFVVFLMPLIVIGISAMAESTLDFVKPFIKIPLWLVIGLPLEILLWTVVFPICWSMCWAVAIPGLLARRIEKVKEAR